MDDSSNKDKKTSDGNDIVEGQGGKASDTEPPVDGQEGGVSDTEPLVEGQGGGASDSEDEETQGLNSAYSVTDLLDELDDNDVYEDANDGQKENETENVGETEGKSTGDVGAGDEGKDGSTQVDDGASPTHTAQFELNVIPNNNDGNVNNCKVSDTTSITDIAGYTVSVSDAVGAGDTVGDKTENVGDKESSDAAVPSGDSVSELKESTRTTENGMIDSGVDAMAKEGSGAGDAADGTETGAPSVDGTEIVAPSVDGTEDAAPSADGTEDAASSADGTETAASSADGTETAASSADGTEIAAPSVDGTEDAAPSADGDNVRMMNCDEIYTNADALLRRKHANHLSGGRDLSEPRTGEGEAVGGTGGTVCADIAGRFLVPPEGGGSEGTDSLDRQVVCEGRETGPLSSDALLDTHPYSNIELDNAEWPEGNDPNEIIYENVRISRGGGGGGTLESTDQYGGWSSSEFESCDEVEEETASQTSRDRRSRSPTESQTVLDKLAAKLGPKAKRDEMDEEDEALLDVVFEMAKIPPATLPSQPEGLSELQIKRRHIVASIVDSENSFVSSLRRIVQDYERPLLQMKSPLLSRHVVRVIFYKVKDILHCHSMFNIELAEHIRMWDEMEQLGNVFTASFSKLMVFNAYSAFVNNFSIAMETAKKQARSKPAFADFLKQRLDNSPDRLSLFGLMVKPVQRFPQFIMLLQDLLKHTPPSHRDRVLLQMALTELETLTHKLNETKRESESRYDVKKILSSLTGRHQSFKTEDSRYLIRQDHMVQVVYTNGETKMKKRRLFLMNDLLLCTSVVIKETESGTVERYRYKWHCPVTEVQAVDEPLGLSQTPRGGPGKSAVTPMKSGDDWAAMAANISTTHPFKKDIDNILHDLPIIEKIKELVGQLNLRYKTLNNDNVSEVGRLLQLSVRQKCDVERCLLQLSASVKGAGRVVHTLQVHSPSVRHLWLQDLYNTKLALEPVNTPGWSVPENEQELMSKRPLFIRPMLMDVTKQETKKLLRKKSYKAVVQCATPVLIPCSEMPGVGIQHLWVCSGDKGRSQVTVASLHMQQPCVVESFRACDAVIMCVEAVPGWAVSGKASGSGDTVWMGTDEHEIVVHAVVTEKRDKPLMVLATDAKVLSLKYLDGRMYAGLKNSTLLIYSRTEDGAWQQKKKETVKLASVAVTWLLALGHDMWAACGRDIYVINVTCQPLATTLSISKSVHQVASVEDGAIQCMVKAGVGLLVSFQNKSVIRVYHLETFDHLQDINIASAIYQLLEGKDTVGDISKTIKISYMLASRGLLWVGTSIGCVLTLPLPRLEGAPQIKARPCVSYHSHCGPIKFLMPINCGLSPLTTPDRASTPDTPVAGGNAVTQESDNRGFSQSDQYVPRPLEGSTLARFSSTPDLHRPWVEEDNLCDMYGSLLHGLDEDFDVALAGPAKSKRRSFLNNVSNMSSALNARLSLAMSQFTPTSPKPKCATLPNMDEVPSSDNMWGDTDASQSVKAVEPSSGPGGSQQGSSGDGGAQVEVVTTPSQYAVPSYVFNKSLMTVSGGEGYINWNKKQAVDSRYEDICLLLWKCRF